MVSSAELDGIVAPLFKRFVSRLRKRLSGKIDMSWLVAEDSPTIYRPDYFEVGHYGPNFGLQFANQMLSKQNYALWRRYAWPPQFDVIFEVMQKGYFPPFLTTYGANHPTLSEAQCRVECEKVFWVLKSTLMRHFYAAPPIINRATFTEIFLIINESLLALFDHLGLPKDLHHNEKHLHHDEFLTIYTTIRDDIFSHDYCHDLLAFLAARANWMDILEETMHHFKLGFRDEINGLLDHGDDLWHQHQFNPHFHQTQFKEWTSGQSKSILYELDNSGEVYFDLLLMEWLLNEGHRITIVAKRSPALNDVMVDDLRHIFAYREMAHFTPHLDSGALRIIDNGSDGVGKQPHHIHKDYISAYTDTDLHILKGQAQFHAMPMGRRQFGSFLPVMYHKPVLYLMGVKAPIIRDCLKQVFSPSQYPALKTLFCYFYNPKDPSTHPK